MKKYTAKYIEKYLVYMKYFWQSTEYLSSSPEYDFDLEQKLIEQCKSGGSLHICEPPAEDK